MIWPPIAEDLYAHVVPNINDFKGCERLEIKIIEEERTSVTFFKGSEMEEERLLDEPVKEPTWLATWFVYDDKKCDHGHLHKIYKTKKNKDLIKLMEEIREIHDQTN